MKKSERRMILVLIIIAIVVIAVLVNIRNKSNDTDNVGDNGIVGEDINQPQEEIGEFVQVLDDGTKKNISNKLAETKTFSNYEVSNIQLSEKDGKSDILADVKNIGTTKADVVLVDITLLDKEGNEIAIIGGIIGDVEPGQSVKLSSSATTDFSNAYDFTIKISEQ